MRRLLCDSFFFLLHWKINVWGLPWKILKTVETFLRNGEQDTRHWIVFKPLRATTVTKPPDVHVAIDYLSVSSQHSIEIHSPNIVICRPEMDNCLPFLLRRKLILLCWNVRAVKRHLFVDKLGSSEAQTVSLTTTTTRCGILNESKSAGSFWYDTLHGCSCQNGQSITVKKLSGIAKTIG